jgi:hypothetical protein
MSEAYRGGGSNGTGLLLRLAALHEAAYSPRRPSRTSPRIPVVGAKRTRREVAGTADFDPERPSFNHLSRAKQQRFGKCETKGLRGLPV